jgi:tetrahydromethanopterin S-methyltransferase subunit H
MLRFSIPQIVCKIDGVEVGGQPGERPTVLVGSLFFSGHRIVRDPLKGTFDRKEAAALLDIEAELSSATGNPRFVDVIGETSEALINYIKFVSGHTGSPILVDSPVQKERLSAIRYFAGSEVMRRLVYNSIADDFTDEELNCLRDCGVKSSIVLAFSTRAMKPEARLRLLQDRLLPAAKQAGIENILVDVGITDVPSVSWASLAIKEVKENLGYPTGCAPANAIYTWEKMRARGVSAFQAAASSVFSLPRLMGADFLLYGSLRNASWVYPAVATADGLIAYSGRFTGVTVGTREHPLYKIF